jgi:hypothetical protein
MRQIGLTRGQVALVDDEDFDSLSKHRWYALKTKNSFYAVRSVGNPTTLVLMHREVLPVGRGYVIDHINSNTLDNRRANLRSATHRQNMAHRLKRKPGTSKFKGVYYCTTKKKWVASIRSEGRMKRLGCFKDETDAAKAYDTSAVSIFGDFALTNFAGSAV